MFSIKRFQPNSFFLCWYFSSSNLNKKNCIPKKTLINTHRTEPYYFSSHFFLPLVIWFVNVFLRWFFTHSISLSLALTLVLDAKYWRNKNQTSEKEIFLWKSVNENEGEPENGNGNGKGQGCFFEQVFFIQYENPNGSKERKKVFFAFLLRMKGEAKKKKKKTYRLLYKSLSILQHAIHNFQ